VGGVYVDAHRLTALSRYLELSAVLGDIPKEQAEGLRGQIFDILFRAGYNPLEEERKYLESEWRYVAQDAKSMVSMSEALQPIEVPVLLEAPTDPMQEWIDAQGGLDSVLKAIQKNGWADTSSWEKDGKKFTVADIKRLGKT